MTLKSTLKTSAIQASIIAKIETSSALKHLKSIIAAADGLMVARGDLAVETGVTSVPYYQKLIIKKANQAGKFVITATQMLESMISNPIPTRAEISDIANAVADHTDALMLSAETAIGRYPLEAVQIMNDTVCFHEAHPFHHSLSPPSSFTTTQAAIVAAAHELHTSLLKNEKVSAFVCYTQTGTSAIQLSQLRPQIPILTFCASPSLARSLAPYFGIQVIYNPDIFPQILNINPEKILQSIHHLSRLGFVKPDDTLIVLHHNAWSFEPGTSAIALTRVPA